MKYFILKPINVKTVINILSNNFLNLLGASDKSIKSVASLENAGKEDLAFCSAEKNTGYKKITNSNAGVIICSQNISDIETAAKNTTLIIVNNPLLCFVECLNYFFKNKKESGIENSARIGKNCKIAPSAYIGQNVTIGDNVQIKNNSSIKSGVYIGNDIQIGKNVNILPNCSIGSEGLGYAKNNNGEYKKIKHLGSIKIGDNVDVGANTVIVRGILQDTIIKNGAKIGNLVNIGHNVFIGKNCFISASAILCGSVRIENNCWIAPQASIRNHIIIGKGATVGLGAVVVKNVPSGATVIGNPAKILEKKI